MGVVVPAGDLRTFVAAILKNGGVRLRETNRLVKQVDGRSCVLEAAVPLNEAVLEMPCNETACCMS